MKSDIEIARSIELKKIKQVAENVGIPREEVENYGRYIAKIPTHLIDEEKVKKSNLILVTAITATKAGIGKTTVSIGLALGLNKIGKKAIVAFGSIKTTVKLDRLERTNAQPKQADVSTKSTYISSQTQDSMYEKKLNFKQDIDVRGMRGDEALQAVTYFVDDAILVGMSRVRILHGTGTGILRTLIRQYLQTIPGVRHFADEHIQLGGAGITVVDLA